MENTVEGAPTWAQVNTTWREVDRALRQIARKRSALDADEARWLRDAEALQIWKPLGMVSALDYMERVLGYAPRTAQERLRVARSLGVLPGTNEALAAGELSFSAVRELTRVATPATEHEWIEATRKMSLRQIEDLVAGHRPGDRPSDPHDVEPSAHVVRLELKPETYAALRQARMVLEQEHGRFLDDDELIAALALGALDGESRGQARHQIVIQRCDLCKRAAQHGGGARIAIDEAALGRAECDAQRLERGRAKNAIPPATARAVRRRDHGRCRVPGCRSARNLEIHHLVHREHGGTHELGNLVLVCASCHKAHHDGRLVISGTADQVEVTRAHVGVRHDATTALGQLGWAPSIARAAVADLDPDPDAPLEQVLRLATERCEALVKA